MNKHDRKAHAQLTDTARLRTLDAIRDPLEDTQIMPVHTRRIRAEQGRQQSHDTCEIRALEARERRKPSTVGDRPAASHARDIFADRQQELIEAGIWPVYE